MHTKINARPVENTIFDTGVVEAVFLTFFCVFATIALGALGIMIEREIMNTAIERAARADAVKKTVSQFINSRQIGT